MNKAINLAYIPYISINSLGLWVQREDFFLLFFGKEGSSLLLMERSNPNLVSIKEEGGVYIEQECFTEDHHIWAFHELNVKQTGIISEPEVGALAYIYQFWPKNLDFHPIYIDSQTWDIFLARDWAPKLVEHGVRFSVYLAVNAMFLECLSNLVF